jgi:hypothetical protein
MPFAALFLCTLSSQAAHTGQATGWLRAAHHHLHGHHSS